MGTQCCKPKTIGNEDKDTIETMPRKSDNNLGRNIKVS
jgi:hypothetical protein